MFWMELFQDNGKRYGVFYLDLRLLVPIFAKFTLLSIYAIKIENIEFEFHWSISFRDINFWIMSIYIYINSKCSVRLIFFFNIMTKIIYLSWNPHLKLLGLYMFWNFYRKMLNVLLQNLMPIEHFEICILKLI